MCLPGAANKICEYVDRLLTENKTKSASNRIFKKYRLERLPQGKLFHKNTVLVKVGHGNKIKITGIGKVEGISSWK
jgi:hypothetical protein